MIYMDNAATTRLDPLVLDAMKPYMTDQFFNPSTLYASEVARAIDEARETVASFVSGDPDGIIFTSGGTEADNLAVAGTVRRISVNPKRTVHILTSAIEHKAILETCRALDREGLSITHYLKPDHTGYVNYMDVKAMIDLDPAIALVSIMAVNNELGTGQELFTIGSFCSKSDHKVLFHTDAVQAMHSERINMRASNIDMLSMSAHKFNGPKGIGALCVRGDALEMLSPIIHGGHQQRGLRAGTENVAGIVGMAKAISLLRERWDARQEYVREIDRRMRGYILTEIPDVIINGREPRDGGTPGFINMSVKGVEAETILVLLANKGIYASSGSACNSGEVQSSYVLKAIGVPEEYINGTIRLTFGPDTTLEDALTTVHELKNIIEFLRKGENV